MDGKIDLCALRRNLMIAGGLAGDRSRKGGNRKEKKREGWMQRSTLWKMPPENVCDTQRGAAVSGERWDVWGGFRAAVTSSPPVTTREKNDFRVRRPGDGARGGQGRAGLADRGKSFRERRSGVEDCATPWSSCRVFAPPLSTAERNYRSSGKVEGGRGAWSGAGWGLGGGERGSQTGRTWGWETNWG